jgi:hypothetical protein
MECCHVRFRCDAARWSRQLVPRWLLEPLQPQRRLCCQQVRVLAARDPRGDIKLWQGRADNGSLVIGSGEYVPQGVNSLVQILPGYFKYGWMSSPQKYAVGVADIQQGAQSAAAAAQRALQVQAPSCTGRSSGRRSAGMRLPWGGIGTHFQANLGPQRRFMKGAALGATLRCIGVTAKVVLVNGGSNGACGVPCVAQGIMNAPSEGPEALAAGDGGAADSDKGKGKTRRGKRAGKHLRSRQSMDSTRASLDGRGSFDGRASLDLSRPHSGEAPYRGSMDAASFAQRLSLDSQRVGAASQRNPVRCSPWPLSLVHYDASLAFGVVAEPGIKVTMFLGGGRGLAFHGGFGSMQSLVRFAALRCQAPAIHSQI